MKRLVSFGRIVPHTRCHLYMQKNRHEPANKRPGADAGWRVLFAFVRPWPRAAQAGRWAKMKICVTFLAVVISIAAYAGSFSSSEYAARISTLSQITAQVGKYPHPKSEFFKSRR